MGLWDGVVEVKSPEMGLWDGAEEVKLPSWGFCGEAAGFFSYKFSNLRGQSIYESNNSCT